MKNTDITKLSLELEQQLIDCKPTSQYLNFVFAHIFDPQDPRNQTNERCYFKFILNYAKKHWYCPETTLILLLVGQRLSLYNGLDINICEKIAFFITDSTCWNYFPLQRNFEKLKKTDTFSLTDNSVVQYFERNARSYPFDLQILIVRVNNDTTWNNRLEKLCHADRVIEAIDTIHQKYVPSDKITMTLECETNNISDYTLSIKALTKYYMHPLCIYPKPESCGLTIEYVHDPLYGINLLENNSVQQTITTYKSRRIESHLTALFINYQRRFLLFKTITSKNYCQLKAEEKQELEKKFLKEKEFAKSPEYQVVIKHYSKIRKLLFVFAPIKISIHLFALFIGLYGVKNGILKIIKNRPFFNVVDSTLYCIALCLNFSAIIAKSWVKKIDQNYKNKYPNLDVEFKGIKNQFAWSRH